MIGGGDASTCASGCNDFVACTVDECVEDTCVHTYDEAMCCTSDQCEIEGACYDNGAENPDNPCEVCRVPESPEEWSADAETACDDGDPCTSGDACLGGSCVGEAYSCEDGNTCTDDVCDGEGGCTNPNNEAGCSDGDACTVGDTCTDGACVAGDTANCDDENSCTSDSCDTDSGCLNEPLDGVACTDPDSCAPSSICRAGECVPEFGDPCDDSNVCTVDACADAACQHNDISSLCADTNPCTDDGCDATDGCVFAFNTNACDDASLCTVMDACSDGMCTGTPVPTDDLNVCTDDSCDPASGVAHTPNTLPCDDGNACLLNETCSGGSCQPGTTPRNCDDQSVCTTDSCDPFTGCRNVDISAQCDDGNACTADRCDPATGCGHSVVQSFTCRPRIVVTSPLRAATIVGGSPGTVVVSGTVTSGAGPITSFTINGTTVAVNPSNGAFTYNMAASPGSNVIVIEASDVLGTEDRIVQSYHYSANYTLPNGTPGTGAVNPGLGIWLDQDSLDDGRAPPPTDLAAIFRSVLLGLDLSTFIDTTQPLAEDQAGYDIYVRSIGFSGATTQLQAIDGGMHVTASLTGITGRLFYDCTSLVCLITGDSGGNLLMDSIVINADLMISVRPDHTLQVTVVNPTTMVNNLRITADRAVLNFLLSIIFPTIRDGLVADLQTDLSAQLSAVLGPLVEDGLSALAINQTFGLPRLDGSTPDISVNLASDFSYTDFQDPTPGPQGGAIGLRAWASAATRGTPTGYPFDANQGVPMRNNCGAPPQQMVIPRIAPLEIVFPDDTMNQILRGAWWGGLLQFPVDPSLLSGVDLTMYGVSNLDLDVSGWLPPIASDCNAAGDLRLYIGDLRIDANMSLFGQPLDAVVYVAFEAPIRLGANSATGEIEIVVSAVENVEVEVHVVQESMLSAQPALQSLLETQLVPALGGLLGGGAPLTSFPLPEMDLSEALGQPPGTSVVRIVPLTAPLPGPERQSGNTIVYGRLQ
jgi:hypothetical protein